MHGAMACMQKVHMHIYGAVAPRHGLQGSDGTLYGSREQEKHMVQTFLCDILWFSMHDVHKVMAIMIDLYISIL